jgi:pimeloyl-ACP methyl ester carboxylesterase
LWTGQGVVRDEETRRGEDGENERHQRARGGCFGVRERGPATGRGIGPGKVVVIEGVTEVGGLRVTKAEPEGRPPEGPPLLFVHGMWDGSWIWRNYLGFFPSRGHVCHALDLRGRAGSSPVPDIGKVRFEEYVEDARAVAQGLGNPVLVGHSAGGLIVQKLAEVLDPPAVVALVPAAPRGVFALASRELLAAALRHAPEILLGKPLMPDKEEMTRLQLNNLPLEERDRVYGLQVPESGRQTFDIAVKGFPVDASKVRCPMLVVGAGRDRITPPQVTKKVAEKYAADLRSYEGFAHMMLLEPGWERVAADVADWLAGALRP